MPTDKDHAEAERIATEAGRLLVEVRERLFRLSVDSRTIKDEGDRRAHEFIMASSFAPTPGMPMNAVSTTIARHSMITWLTPTRISVRAAGM